LLQIKFVVSKIGWGTGIFGKMAVKGLRSNISACPHNMVNFGLLAAEIYAVVWGTTANFNGFRILSVLLHGTPVLGVSQTCGIEQRAPPIFGRAAITLGIGPHSSVFILCCRIFLFLVNVCVRFSFLQLVLSQGVGNNIELDIKLTLS